jgi:Ricin-type beta-trefoil lectin domain-like
MQVHSLTRGILVVLSFSVSAFTQCPANAQELVSIYSALGYLHPAIESGGSYTPGGPDDAPRLAADGAPLATSVFSQRNSLWRRHPVPGSGTSSAVYFFCNEGTKKCMDISGGSVVQRDCSNAQSQQWFTDSGGGGYTLRNRASGTCATVNHRVYSWFFPCCRSLPVELQNCPAATSAPAEQVWTVPLVSTVPSNPPCR